MKRNSIPSSLEKKFMEAMWLVQACGNLEIQVVEAARRGNKTMAKGFSNEAKETLCDLDAVLKSIGLGVLSKKFRKNTESYIQVAEQYFERRVQSS